MLNLLFLCLLLFINKSTATCGQYYIVVSGDTCYKISQAYGISLTMIESMNPGINCNSLQVGQKVCVGGGGRTTKTTSTKKSKCSKYYTVVQGDTCYQISINYGISLDTLEKLNPGIDCNYLQIGQKVCVGKWHR